MLFNWFKKKEQKISEPEMTQIMIYSEPMVDKLVDKGLRDFLVYDFEYKENSVDIAKIRNSGEAETALRPVLTSILNYLKLPPFIGFKVYLSNDPNNFMAKQNKAGLYQSGWFNKTISINIGRDYSFINVLATMCHECTHYFMEYNHLNWKDTDLNEERTDMMACLIGFSDILCQGYKKIEIVEHYLNYTRTRTSKIGYITNKECEELREYILYRRYLIKEEIKKEEELKAKLEKLYSLIELIKKFDEQIEALNPVTHSELYKSENVDFKILQKCISDINSLNTKSVYSSLERAAKSEMTLASVESNIAIAEKQCSDMLSIINSLQKLSKQSGAMQ